MTDIEKYNIAAIDIGSNSIHLVIASVDKNAHLQILDDYKEHVRLFKQLSEDKIFLPPAFEKCKKTLMTMMEISKNYNASIKAVATQAMREARNHKELIDFLRFETSINIQIIAGNEEARLSFLGMRQALALEHILALGIDIGGGSTELIIAKGDKIEYITSFKLGSLGLSQYFFQLKTPNLEQICQAKNHIESVLYSILGYSFHLQAEKAVFTSGTMKSLLQIHSLLETQKPSEELNGYTIHISSIKKIEKLLTDNPDPKFIANKYQLDHKKAEVVLAGTLLLSSMSKILKVDSWTYSSYGLREGLAIDSLARKGIVIDKFRDIRWQAIVKFGEKYNVEKAYSSHIANLSITILDQLSLVIANPELLKYRYLLIAASYLSEVGKFISFARFHKHTHYIIAKGGIIGFSQNEKQLIALIARYSRKKPPNINHKSKNHLLQEHFQIIQVLSSSLRIAAALNRTRQQKVYGLSICQQEKKLVFHLSVGNGFDNLDSELKVLAKEQKILQKTIGQPLCFRVGSGSQQPVKTELK